MNLTWEKLKVTCDKCRAYWDAAESLCALHEKLVRCGATKKDTDGYLDVENALIRARNDHHIREHQ